MQVTKKKKTKICILSSVPITLKSFYSDLIVCLKNYDWEVVLITSNASELNRLGDALGCNVFSTSISRQISPFRDLASICRLFYYFRKEKCEILHAHTPKGGLIGMISAWCAGVCTRVYTIHGLVLETAGGYKRKLLWFCEWLACRLATDVLSVSPSLRQRVIDEGICPAHKIQVLGKGSACGINLKKFFRGENFNSLRSETRAKYNIPDDAVVIGFLGRIVPDKGIETLICSFEQLQTKSLKCYLLLVGNFETFRNKLGDETIRKIESNPNIVCNGQFVSDVLQFYAAMDILTLPSKREGFGLTLIEASALKLPVIATKITGCVDAVVDKVTGLLVDVDDVEGLSDAMLKLARNPELRKSLGQKGYERARVSFDSEMLVREHVVFYKRILSRNKS
jgi:glycosyltransferase involved in cell wall biosynthesis